MKTLISVAAAGTVALLTAVSLLYARAQPPHPALPPTEGTQAKSKTTADADPVVVERNRRLTAPAHALLNQSAQALERGDASQAERTYFAAQEYLRALPPPDDAPPTLRHGYWFACVPMPPRLLGDIYMAQGRYRDAIEAYGVARRHPTGYVLDLNTALAFVRMGQPIRARQFFHEKFLRKQRVPAEDIPAIILPHSLEARILLARGGEYMTRGNNRHALTDFEAAGRLDPDNSFIRYQAARAAEFGNDLAKAAAFYRDVVRLAKGKRQEEAKRRLANVVYVRRVTERTEN